MKNALFISITSDLSFEIAKHLYYKGWKISGTYREMPDGDKFNCIDNLDIFKLDVQSPEGIEEITNYCSELPWDLLMISPSAFGPISNFGDCQIDEWVKNFNLNSINLISIVHKLLPYRNSKNRFPLIWFWGGPGTNSAPKLVSSLCLAKICQIKFAELLDSEYDDIISFSVGPGWVFTKTHQQILELGPEAGEKYNETIQRINSGNMTKISTILKFTDWIISQPKEVIGGRNFSIRSDLWQESSLFEDFLKSNPDANKLRRYKNDWRPDQLNTDFNPK